MRIRKPSYYDSFRCTASACSDTCCAGWEIGIDPDSRERYRKMEGPLGEKLRASMKTEGEDCSFRLVKGERCPFLTEENLCQLILEKGEETLCAICREYPRFHRWFGSLMESGLGLCCEEAARLILNDREPGRLLEEEGEGEEEHLREEDLPLLDALFLSRETAFSLLLHADLSPGESCCLLLLFAAELQDLLDQEDAAGISRLSGSYSRVGKSLACDLGNLLENSPAPEEIAGKLLAFFAGLEPLDTSWPQRLLSLRESLFALLPRVREEISPKAERFRAYKNLLVYFVYRYWMQSFFDGEILPKAKLFAAGYFLIRLLDEADRSLSSKISPEISIQNAKAFSKEVEYSEENLSAFYTAAWEEDFLSLSSLFPLLL